MVMCKKTQYALSIAVDTNFIDNAQQNGSRISILVVQLALPAELSSEAFIDIVTEAAKQSFEALGPYTLEGHYERLMLKKLPLDLQSKVKRQLPIHLQLNGLTFEFRPDVIIGDVVVELKANDTIGQREFNQTARYMRILNSSFGLVIHMNSKKGKVEVHKITIDSNNQLKEELLP